MIDLKTLEELRTKEELINYFKQLGKNITEEEINKLKQSYDKIEGTNEILTLRQLDDVAEGMFKLYHMGKLIHEGSENVVPGYSASCFDIYDRGKKYNPKSLTNEGSFLYTLLNFNTYNVIETDENHVSLHKLDCKDKDKDNLDSLLSCIVSHDYTVIISSHSPKKVTDNLPEDESRAFSFENSNVFIFHNSHLASNDKLIEELVRKQEESEINEKTIFLDSRSPWLLYAGLTAGVLAVFASAATAIALLTPNNN